MIEIDVYGLGALSCIPVIVYWILLIVLVLGVAIILSSQRARIVPRISLLLLIEWVAFIFCFAVIFREVGEENSINLTPFWSYFNYAENSYLKEMAAINFLNVCMFVPIGMLLKSSIPQIRRKQMLPLGLALSASIELSQLVFKKGLCEVDDVIHNVLGGMIGYAIATVTMTLTIKKYGRENKEGKELQEL